MRVGWLPPANHTRLCCHEFQMRLVTQPLWLSDGKLTFVDATGVRAAGFARDDRRRTLLMQLLRYRWMLPPAVETRWARYWRCVIGVKSEPLFWSNGRTLDRRHRWCANRIARPVECKTKRLAERGEGTFGGVGFR